MVSWKSSKKYRIFKIGHEKSDLYNYIYIHTCILLPAMLPDLLEGTQYSFPVGTHQPPYI